MSDEWKTLKLNVLKLKMQANNLTNLSLYSSNPSHNNYGTNDKTFVDETTIEYWQIGQNLYDLVHTRIYTYSYVLQEIYINIHTYYTYELK